MSIGNFCNFLLVTLVSMTLSMPVSAAAEEAFGNWKDTETGATFSVYSCGRGLCIKVLRSKADGEKDVNNPHPALRDRAIAGILLMSDAAQSSQNDWKGQLYNAEDGKIYTGYVRVQSTNAIKLEGCILGGLICRSRIWQRI